MNFRTITAAIAVLAVFTAAPQPASAQFGKLKDKIKQKVDAKIDKKVDCTLDKVVDKKECEKQNAAVDAKTGSNGPAGAGTQSAGGAASAAAALAPGHGAWANYDFVPGDKIMFAEDFTTDRVGNFPKRLELEEGTMEVVEWPEGSGKRWVRNTTEAAFSVVLPEALPERWTMEFVMTIPWSGMYIYPGAAQVGACSLRQCIEISGTSVVAGTANGKNSSLDPRTLFGESNMFASTPTGQAYTSRPFNIRIQADGKYMKMYLDEQRVINMPNMGAWTGKVIRFEFRDNTLNGKQWPVLLSNISVNSGGRELYDKLMADGRLAVQGIYFSTGSAEIRPESSGTLAEIVDMLKSHADLKLTVEGHTDNVGDAAKNRTLSEQRAAAVVAYLTAKGVAADRLKSAGFGDSKPAAANDSPENRQKNRRVELVKM